MRKAFTILSFIIILVGLSYLAGANPNGGITYKNDKVTLFTDRNLYISGEKILFSAFIDNDAQVKSSVLYIEIVSQDGLQVYSDKYQIFEKKASGTLTIPTNLSTGDYYVKAYTRWMRNFSPIDYSYTSIKVVNIDNQAIAPISSGNGKEFISLYEASSTSKTNAITTNREVYLPRDTAIITIDASQFSTPIDWACLTIASSSSVNTLMSRPNDVKSKEFTYYFKPEDNGISISGRVVNSDSGAAEAYTLVNISILGPYPDFTATHADSLGYFSVVLPQVFGNYDLYIGSDGNSSNRISIDNDFCTKKIGFENIQFSMSSEEYSAAQNIINNIEVANHFSNSKPYSCCQTKNQFSTTLSFYGTPDIVFDFKKYVNLLSVKEYFHELIPVTVKEKKGRITFGFKENHAEFKIFEPLILIDNMVITDASRIFATDPTLLSHVEIITKPYYKGAMVYGGVVSFFSKKGNFAGIELPSSDLFLNYKFYSSESSCNISQTICKDSPDTRNTVLWINNLKIEEDNITTITFEAPETKGEYDILLRGVNKKGKISFERKTIIVQ